MTSYPSQYLTELLSKFLEFDSHQLQLGIFSTDWSLKDVRLKREAFSSLLKVGSDGLNMKLVSGKIGHMRLRIPWKRLVWGQGDVRLEVSDVKIVLTLEARKESKYLDYLEMNASNMHGNGDEVEKEPLSDEQRERKHAALEEAERRMLQGLPIRFALNHEENHNNQTSKQDEANGQERETGRIDSFVKKLTSTFLWRMIAGLQGSIRNLRVSIVQENIETGFILQSLEIHPTGEKEGEMTTAPETPDFSENENSEDKTIASPPDRVEYEGAYEDGEHVDQQIKVQGLGFFIKRQHPFDDPYPPALGFSLSVSPEDYILRPTNLTLCISFFYPYSSEKKRQKRKQKTKTAETTDYSSTIKGLKHGSNESIAGSTSSSKIRRGKREKSKSYKLSEMKIETDMLKSASTVKSFRKSDSGDHSSQPFLLRPLASNLDMKDTLNWTQSDWIRSDWIRNEYTCYYNSAVSECNVQTEKELPPHFDLQIECSEVKTVFSKYHFKNFMAFSSTLTRIMNGRPKIAISSVLNEESQEGIHSVTVDAPFIDSPNSSVVPPLQPNSQRAKSSEVEEYSTPQGNRYLQFSDVLNAENTKTPHHVKSYSDAFYNHASVEAMTPGLSKGRQNKLSFLPYQRIQLSLNPRNESEKRRVVKSWWLYAFNNVIQKVREKRARQSSFAQTFQFDWMKQKYLRREYVNLYLRTHLKTGVIFHQTYLHSGIARNKLQEMEDELFIEQILLYRAIARALHVMHVDEMQDTVAILGGSRGTLCQQSGVRKLRRDRKTITKATFKDNHRLDSPADNGGATGLQKLCKEARNRRLGNKKSSTSLIRSSYLDGFQQERDNFRIGLYPKEDTTLRTKFATRRSNSMESGFFSIDVAAGTPTISSRSKTAASWVTAKQEQSNESAKKPKPFYVSFTLNFQSIELLVMKSEGYEKSKESFNFTESSSMAALGGHFTDANNEVVHQEDQSRDDISILTDDEIFADGDTTDFVVDEDEALDQPILSSTDFLTFTPPEDVVLEFHVSPLIVLCGGRSGGDKKMSLSVGSIMIEGAQKSEMLTMGRDNHDDSSVKPLRDIIDPTKKEENGLADVEERIKLGTMDAVRASFLLREGQRNFLEVDFARILATLDMETIASIHDFFSLGSNLLLPKPLLEYSEFDRLRDCKSAQLRDFVIPNLITETSCAFRLHGIECMLPAASNCDASSSSSSSTSVKLEKRKALKISITLIEFYNGTLLNQIACTASSNENESIAQFTTAFSCAEPTDFGLASDRKLQFLDLEKLLKQARLTNAENMLINASGLAFAIHTPSKFRNELTESLPLQKELVNFELFFSCAKKTGHSRQHAATLALSPLHAILSPERVSFLSALLKTSITFGGDDNEKIPPLPRLESLSSDLLSTLTVSIDFIGATIIEDGIMKSDDYENNLMEKELLMEECITDYLSFFSCFDLQFVVPEAPEAARNICVQRLIGVGFDRTDAYNCAETARLQFLDDIALVQKTQVQTLINLSSASSKIIVKDEECPLEQSEPDLTLSENVSVLSEMDHLMEDNSQESSDLIETALQNAVEQTVASFLPLLKGYSPTCDNIRIEAQNGLKIFFTRYFYDSHIMAVMESFSVHGTSGLQVLSVGDKQYSKSTQSHELMPKEGDTMPFTSASKSCYFSLFSVENGYNFASGGCPDTILAVDEYEDESRYQDCLIDLAVDNIEILFCSTVFIEITDAIHGLLVAPEASQSTETPTSVTQKPLRVETTFCFDNDQLSLILTTEEVCPFSQLVAKSISLVAEASNLTLEANDFLLLNLAPEGQYFPRIMQSLKTEPELISGLPTPAMLRVTYFSNRVAGYDIATFAVEVVSARIVFLNQYVLEMVQYICSKDYGIGRLLATLASKSSHDDQMDTSSPPLHYTIRLSDSSLIIPRESTDTDMVAIECSEILASNSYLLGSFKMPNESKSLDKGNPIFSYEKSEAASSLGSVGSLNEFFDAIDTSFSSNVSQVPIGYSRDNLIARTTVRLFGAKVFTSSSPIKTKNKTSIGIRYLKKHRFNGRASNEKPVFVLNNTEEANEEFTNPSLCWECITKKPFSLEVLVDYAPHLRVLLTDSIDDKVTCPLDLEMRMSQLYLLLSCYYGNVQELPTLFPYSAEVTKRNGSLPKPSPNFPDYGTDEYVKMLSEMLLPLKFEFACCFEALSMQCGFDARGCFDIDPEVLNSLSVGNMPAFSLALRMLTVHVATDTDGVMRIGCGAQAFVINDHRRAKPYDELFSVGDLNREQVEDNIQAEKLDRIRTWADLSFGLDLSGGTLVDGSLGLPFQASVFMTPNWNLINVGAASPNATVIDISSPINLLLSYFSSYWSDAAFGNPCFEVKTRKDSLKQRLEKTLNLSAIENTEDSLNIDFRLWILQPLICIPYDLKSLEAPSLRIMSKSGFWYQLKSMGCYSSQEMGSPALSIQVSDIHECPRQCRDLISNGNWYRNSAINFVDGLSFGLRMDHNQETNHSDYVFCMPMWNKRKPSNCCRVTSRELEIPPIKLQIPTVCSPVKTIGREIGPLISEITLCVKYLPAVSFMMMRLLGFDEDTVDRKGPNDITSQSDSTPKSDPSFVINAQVEGLRLFLIDPVLGIHLPIAVSSLSSLKLSASKLCESLSGLQIKEFDSPPSDLQVAMEASFWVDHFKLGTTRSWEPLLEPFNCFLMYEKSMSRGQGHTITSDIPFHANVTGSLLLSLEDAIDSLSQIILEFGKGTDDVSGKPEEGDWKNDINPVCIQHFVTVQERLLTTEHHRTKPRNPKEKVSFSFLNLTGQRIRIHQSVNKSKIDQEKKNCITYLNHKETTSLEFRATVTLVQNMKMVEVPFPGLPFSQCEVEESGAQSQTLNIQVAGFKWLQNLSVDTSGRRFEDLVPRSDTVQAKILKDWRLANTMKLLTEVGLDNGGRLISARSIFEIRNHTTHELELAYHPDPMHKPLNPVDLLQSNRKESRKAISIQQTEKLSPGAAFQVPSLLLESALQLEGSHLGSIWMRPVNNDENRSLFDFLIDDTELNLKDPVVFFSSRPVQLAKIVNESAQLFKAANGEDLPPEKVRSGIRTSCNIADGGDGVFVAPFCYAIEIRRSPIVSDLRGLNDLSARKVNFTKSETQGTSNPKSRETTKNLTHGPVAYTLMLHPPIIIENLLPTEGRFELMHATRKSVLWFADIKPGEKISVHTVGLDAPLLLLVNLGFCRTPIGEGALIHHGSERAAVTFNQGGLKSIGKAVTKGTKQIGKTLTSISDTPDRRGKGKLFLVNNPQYHGIGNNSNQFNKTINEVASSERDMGLDPEVGKTAGNDGRIHMVDSRVYTSDDIATETLVVDSVGQKLILGIENVRGGGGQRRVSLFCPYWIVNSTEHPLRYKQEKSSSFVSGTVSSKSLDGSRPVDRSKPIKKQGQDKPSNHLKTVNNKDNELVPTKGMVFAGTPGALADLPGRCSVPKERLARLLEKDLELDELASIAFMFNFHEDVLLIGHQRLCVQLADGTGRLPYHSEWSAGFSLESVGVPQLVGMHCKDGRVLELSVTMSVAPGFLSGYTKIVRFSPRYIVVNQLGQPIRLWQDSSLIKSAFTDRKMEEFNNKSGDAWHFQTENEQEDKVNQYEVLFGRPASVEDVELGTVAHKQALYIATIAEGDLVPFHLPDTRGDRQFRIDLGMRWNLTPSFNADVTGEHTLKIAKALDLRMLSHVNTRQSPHYKVTLPPEPADRSTWDGELGVWFETSWGGDRKILVKGTKRGTHAFNNTEIRVGDELLKVDEQAVSQLSFSETMKLLKERLAFVSAAYGRETVTNSNFRLPMSQRKIRRKTHKAMDTISENFNFDQPPQIVLTFRTLEEQYRRVRVKASAGHVSRNLSMLEAHSRDRNGITSEGILPSTEKAVDKHPDIKVEMRAIHNSIFVVVRKQDTERPPYKIENRAINHFILFRQRGCDGFAWNILHPGESAVYTWEEPMRTHKLSVRVGLLDVHYLEEDENDNETTSSNTEQESSELDKMERVAARRARLKQLLSSQYVETEDQSGFGTSTTVKLEEIGFKCELPCPPLRKGVYNSSEQVLNCYIDSDGGTRVLIVSNDKGHEEESLSLQAHINSLNRLIREEEHRAECLRTLNMTIRRLFNERAESVSDKGIESISLQGTEKDRSYEAEISQIEAEAVSLADFPDDCTISTRNQLVIQVLEAAGLKQTDVVGHCNPYCEVFLRGRSKRNRGIFSSKGAVKKKTYYMNKTTSPKWIDQYFVFDVHADAVQKIRDYTAHIKVRHFRIIGQHAYLGQINVPLRCLRDQKELIGWYPLVGRTGRHDLESSQANWGRGSVKLRLQWIYTVPALVDYFLMLSENKLLELHRSHEGMKEQLEKIIETEALTNAGKLNQKTLKDPFGVATKLFSRNTPRKKMSLSSLRQSTQSRQSNQSEEAKPDRIFSWKAPMEISRERLMWLFNNQTQSSRLARHLTLEKENLVRNTTIKSSNVDEMSILAPMAPGETPTVGPHASPRDRVENASLFHIKEEESMSFRRSNIENTDAGTVGLTSNVESPMVTRNRCRTLSLEDVKNSMEAAEFSKWSTLAQSTSIDSCGQIVLPLNLKAESNIRTLTPVDSQDDKSFLLEKLRERGLLFHSGKRSFIKNHLIYHFRRALIDRAVDADIHPKSLHRLSRNSNQFKTSISAVAVLNDPAILSNVAGAQFNFSLQQQNKNRVNFRSKLQLPSVLENASRKFYMEKLGLSSAASKIMRKRLEERGETLFKARNDFERACKRSQKSVLNPGGTLAVRPITAMNLPDSYVGMTVKLQYGSFSITSPTVDARVTPVWAADDSTSDRQKSNPMLSLESLVSPRNINSFQTVLGEGGNETNDDAYYDLSIPVEAHKTSGTIRISVIGERLNHRVELGVLVIPLGAAISCCVDSIENVEEENTELGPDDAMYVRWFPLMTPKDCVQTEGDMRYNWRPKETEKENYTQFNQYFSPCIKLALIWRPKSNETARNIKQENSPLTSFYLNADISRMSAALISSHRAVELIALSASDIDIRWSESKIKQGLSFVVGWIQIDYQSDESVEPVVLAPTPVLHHNPTLQFLFFKDNLRSKGKIDSFELIAFYVEELDILIEEAWVIDIWDFLVSVIRKREVKKRALQVQCTTFMAEKFELQNSTRFKPLDGSENQPLLQSLWQDDNSEAKTYVEKLYLGPIRLNLTYVKGRRASSYIEPEINLNGNIRDVLSFGDDYDKSSSYSEVFSKWAEFTHDEDLWSETGEGKISRKLPTIIAKVLPSISDAPIRLNGKGITFIFENRAEIFNSVKNYYVNELLRQIYKVLGSVDIVGSPFLAVSSFATGFRDFLVTPSKEFMRSPNNPSRVGIGCAKGTLSLVSHCASGCSGLFARLFANFGHFLALVSCDAEYQRWHRDSIEAEMQSLDRYWKRRGLEAPCNIVTRPFVDVINGVAYGISGLITMPIHGARKDGCRGLTIGVCLGGSGVFVKPLVGIFDAVAHVAGSIHDFAKSVNVLEKRYQPPRKLRLPYTFGLKNVLIPFNPTTARCVLLLKKFPISKNSLPQGQRGRNIARSEVHVASEVLDMEIGVKTFLVVSTVRVALFKMKRSHLDLYVSTLCWEVPLFDQENISTKVQEQGHNGLALTVTVCPKSSVLSNDQAASQAPINEVASLLDSEDEDVSDKLGVSMINTRNVHFLPDPNSAWTNKCNSDLTYFTVLADFNHRRQLTRIHNAICCVTGQINSIIVDRGLNKNGSTEGYTSFVDFTFTEGKAIKDISTTSTLEQNDCTYMEYLPWVPEAFFTDIKGLSDLEASQHFAELRSSWTLEKEKDATQRLGGPTWLVEARAKATYVSETPTNIRNSKVMQKILSKLLIGSISSEEARKEISREESKASTLIVEECSSDGEAKSTSSYISTVEFTNTLPDQYGAPELFKSSLTTEKRSDCNSETESRNVSRPMQNDHFKTAEIWPEIEMIHNGDSSKSMTRNEVPIEMDEIPEINLPILQGRLENCNKESKDEDENCNKESEDKDAVLDQQREKESSQGDESANGECPLSKSSEVDEEVEELDREISQIGVEGGISSLKTSGGAVDSSPRRSEENVDNNTADTIEQKTDRMDRLEIMLEKLVQVSLNNVQKAPLPSGSNSVGVDNIAEEIALLRNQIKLMEEREAKTVDSLRQEIAELKKMQMKDSRDATSDGAQKAELNESLQKEQSFRAEEGGIQTLDDEGDDGSLLDSDNLTEAIKQTLPLSDDEDKQSDLKKTTEVAVSEMSQEELLLEK